MGADRRYDGRNEGIAGRPYRQPAAHRVSYTIICYTSTVARSVGTAAVGTESAYVMSYRNLVLVCTNNGTWYSCVPILLLVFILCNHTCAGSAVGAVFVL